MVRVVYEEIKIVEPQRSDLLATLSASEAKQQSILSKLDVEIRFVELEILGAHNACK